MFSFTVCICCTEIAVLEGRGVSVYRDRNIQHRPFLNNQTEFQQGIVSVWKQQCACVFTIGTQMVCECSLPVSAIVLFSLSWHYYWMGAAGHVHVNVHKTQWAWLWAGCIKMNKDVILCRKCAQMCLICTMQMCIWLLNFVVSVLSQAHQSMVCKFALTVGGWGCWLCCVLWIKGHVLPVSVERMPLFTLYSPPQPPPCHCASCNSPATWQEK